MIESYAFKLAIQLCFEKNLQPVVIEPNYQAVINRFTDPRSMCNWRTREVLIKVRNLASSILLLECS